MGFSGWKEYELEEIANVQTGPFGSQLHKRDYADVGTPIITVEHLGDNRIENTNLPRVKKEDVERLSKYVLKENDIVFSRVGSVDRRALVQKEQDGWLFSGRCLRVRVTSKNVNPVYLSYYFGMESFKEYVRSIAVGATMPSLNTKIMKGLPIKVPEKAAQDKIAYLLDSFTNKIYLNRKTISTLEQLAQTLFKRWFIDFEYPNAYGEPYQSSGGEMVESELGLIPKGWEESSVSDVANIMSGGTPKTKVEEYWHGDIAFFTPKDASITFYVDKTEKSITELGLSKCNSRLYPENTIFITARGTVGKLNLSASRMAMNQSCYALRHKKGFQYYLFLALGNIVKSIVRSATGAVFDAITVRDFNIFKVLSVPDHILKSFENQVAPLFESIRNYQSENVRLEELRNTLLPKLLSGEIERPTESEATDHVSVS